MTRKDYKMIAGVINYAFNAGRKTENTTYIKQQMTQAFCVHLKRDNPRFDNGKFLDACYAEQEIKT
jgi:hypothetical protein